MDSKSGSQSRFRPPRFTLTTIMLVMLVACVMSAGGFYMVQGWRTGWSLRLRFLIFVVSAPLIMVTLLSLFWSLFEKFRRR